MKEKNYERVIPIKIIILYSKFVYIMVFYNTSIILFLLFFINEELKKDNKNIGNN